MPRRLLDRCNDDSLREFRAAARQRFNDALVLAANGRRTGAIYLWGYAVEMTLKAAYFSMTRLITGFLKFGVQVFSARFAVFFRVTLPHDDVAVLRGELA